MKKIGLIIFALVMGLGVLGVGYAAWQQTLNVNASVQAATFDVHFINATPPEFPGANVFARIDGPHEASIVVNNVTPNMAQMFMFVVANSGSVPVEATLSETSDPENFFTVTTPPMFIPPGENMSFMVNFSTAGWEGSGTFNADFQIVATQATAVPKT